MIVCSSFAGRLLKLWSRVPSYMLYMRRSLSIRQRIKTLIDTIRSLDSDSPGDRQEPRWMKSLLVNRSRVSSSFDNRLPHLEKSAVAEDNSLRCTRDVAPVIHYIATDWHPLATADHINRTRKNNQPQLAAANHKPVKDRTPTWKSSPLNLHFTSPWSSIETTCSPAAFA